MAERLYRAPEKKTSEGSRLTLEGYAIRMRMFRSEYTGRDHTGRKTYRGIHEYRTDNGTFSPEVWKLKTMEAITAAGETALLDELKAYCRENCAWLHRETEIQEHAMQCLVSRAYLHWNDFMKEKEIIWM